jgi:hypothetical protein
MVWDQHRYRRQTAGPGAATRGYLRSIAESIPALITLITAAGASKASTTMRWNKANFTIEELGWRALPPCDLKEWDGLTSWFLRQAKVRKELQESGYLRRWANAATRTLPGTDSNGTVC